MTNMSCSPLTRMDTLWTLVFIMAYSEVCPLHVMTVFTLFLVVTHFVLYFIVLITAI